MPRPTDPLSDSAQMDIRHDPEHSVRQPLLAPTERARFVAVLLCLLVGVLIYAVARPTPAWFLPAALHRPLQFGSGWQIAVGSAPTFLHVVAFSLLTAIVQSGGHKATALCCVGWTCTNLLFELGQHPVASEVLTRHIPTGLDRLWLLGQLRPFFERGHFDPNDLCATVLGGAVAYWLAHQLQPESNDEEP
jgi:hypothetical protein